MREVTKMVASQPSQFNWNRGISKSYSKISSSDRTHDTHTHCKRDCDILKKFLFFLYFFVYYCRRFYFFFFVIFYLCPHHWERKTIHTYTHTHLTNHSVFPNWTLPFPIHQSNPSCRFHSCQIFGLSKNIVLAIFVYKKRKTNEIKRKKMAIKLKIIINKIYCTHTRTHYYLIARNSSHLSRVCVCLLCDREKKCEKKSPVPREMLR